MICEAPLLPFFGSRVQTDLTLVHSDFAFIGIPYGVPYGPASIHSDASNAPGKLRERSARFAGHADRYDFDLGGPLLGSSGATMVDCGNVPGSLDADQNARNASIAMGLLLRNSVIPIVIGGDDSVPHLCLRAFERFGPINVLQIDAHIDFRDSVHGIRDGYSSNMRRITEMPWVKRVVQVGARGTGSARCQDVEDAKAAGNILVSAETVAKKGPASVTEHIHDDFPWFVTIDVDGLDPTIAPATATPVPGGLNFADTRDILRFIAGKTQLAGIDIVEHFPSLDVGHTTSIVLARLLANTIGHAARRLPVQAPKSLL
jgi:agmatinase